MTMELESMVCGLLCDVIKLARQSPQANVVRLFFLTCPLWVGKFTFLLFCKCKSIITHYFCS